MTRPLVLVGECRSLTAIRRGWRWKDGRLAAKPLFEALAAMGVDPAAQRYVNLWTDPPLVPVITSHRKEFLRHHLRQGAIVVALGNRVSAALTELEIDHVAIVHPAARGRIRKRERYIAHVAERLAGHVTPTCQARTARHDGTATCTCSPSRRKRT